MTNTHTNMRIVLLAVLAVLAPAAAQAADNTRYVSVTGSNANACTLAAPCRSLQRGINVTPAGGDLQILDSGSYGNNANIRKSLTISGNGNTIFPAATILIDNADAVVVLRGLVLDGQGTVVDGIEVEAAATVHIERCVIYGYADEGFVAGVTAGLRLFVMDSILRDNGGDGLQVFGGGAPFVAIDKSRFENNGGVGVRLSSGGHATISRSTASGNGTGGILTSNISVNVVSTTVASNGLAGLQVGTDGRMMVESTVIHDNGTIGLNVGATTGTARISNSTIINNNVGINNLGTVLTRENNTVIGNTTADTAGNALTPLGGV